MFKGTINEAYLRDIASQTLLPLEAQGKSLNVSYKILLHLLNRDLYIHRFCVFAAAGRHISSPHPKQSI